MFSNLFDMIMIYYYLSTVWCTYFIITCVLPLLTTVKLYHTCLMYETYLLKFTFLICIVFSLSGLEVNIIFVVVELSTTLSGKSYMWLIIYCMIFIVFTYMCDPYTKYRVTKIAFKTHWLTVLLKYMLR